jgi:hypothetical protein
VDQDGVPDYVIGNRYGIVRLFSGRTGATIWRWEDPQKWYANLFGSAVAGGVDLDRDGIPDVIVVASNEFIPGGGWGAVYLFSGRDGSLLQHFSADGMNRFPWGVISVPPQPQDRQQNPFGLFMIGQPLFRQIGRLALLRGLPQGVQPFGAPCAGSLATPPKIGLRNVDGKATRLHLSGAEPGSPAVLLLGLSRTQFAGVPLPLSLAPFGFTGCSLMVSINEVLLATAGTVGNARGYASVDLDLPTPGPGTFTLHGQWLAPGAGATSPGGASDAILWRH